MLILVRHAIPSYGPETPAHEWELSPDGHAAARRLAAALPTSAYLVASNEPKAFQTLAAAGPVLRDPRFNEVSRIEPWEGEYRRLRREYVSGTDHTDWEPRTAVATRFDTAVREHLAAAHGTPVIIATHGMAMTIWLTSRRLLEDPAAFWANLNFPDAHLIDHANNPGTVTRHPAATPNTTS